ncbi:hypothetical protein BJ322DRAFT_1010304 [Thelephora terrestris]|uniref:Uncharacterized protein n=1 Tax=Thelephora terrestris TaxID=56493 RepID=A0A9P6HCG4_9AGAM|nr:hypothetical protein BJ322DRAFT_1010304 [Thelephora terrestris]
MSRTPYNGASRKLVLAFDIGTTYSGAAYAFLDPGEVPQINMVTKYLDNPNAGTAKVPSILYYDQDGNFRGVENGTGLQEDESLLQMRWFVTLKYSSPPATYDHRWKLMFEPTGPPAALKGQMSREIPIGKTIVDVLSDFMRYLFDSTKALFIFSDPNGEHRWNLVSDHIELVLTHPNGWGGPEQSQFRAAAVLANIVPDTQDGHARVHFVTEGEASFNFCATHNQAGESLKHGDKVLIVDAGGGTIDISSYVVTGDAPLQVEELFRPECLLQGGEFVTARAREMASERLRKSKFNTPEDIAAFAQKFDEGTKRVFSNDEGLQYIKFGSLRDNDPQHGIKAGKMTLTGKQVSGFFEPSIQSTVEFVKENFTGIFSVNLHAFLVGGFASSPWLTDQLNRRLSDLGLTFFKPDTNTNKAVAVGAVSSYIDHFVKGRISKFAYGVSGWVVYNPSNPEHVNREDKVFINAAGKKCVPGFFSTMLSKVWHPSRPRSIHLPYGWMGRISRAPRFSKVSAPIIRYDGNQKEPEWMDTERNRFKTLCHVVADISAARSTCTVGKSGKPCYSQEYDVVLLVGLTELKAEIRWLDSTTVRIHKQFC